MFVERIPRRTTEHGKCGLLLLSPLLNHLAELSSKSSRGFVSLTRSYQSAHRHMEDRPFIWQGGSYVIPL